MKARHNFSASPQQLKGMTLLEILVVLAIMAIIASIVVPNVMGNRGKAQIDATKTAIKAVEGSLDIYNLDNFTYPSTEQGLAALTSRPGGEPVAKNWNGPYVKNAIVDAWQRPLQYLNPGQHGKLDIYSLGADGKPGGEGENADIGNWEK
jgi:general secretion pathway protein G